MTIHDSWDGRNRATLFRGDCLKLLQSIPDDSVDLVLTSPPYCIGKTYENEKEAGDFLRNHEAVLPEIVRVTKQGGSICWQVGYHVKDGVLTPLDFIVYGILSKYPNIALRNRIIWTFGHGLHSTDRFSGRHETILWFTKGLQNKFNLDRVRVRQKYPGKRAYKGTKKGKPSGNPLGKNPSDVWEIPNVKANHVEKCDHPCQFPITLVNRLINALTNEKDIVLDPYAGTGTTGAAAILSKRRFVGAEINKDYHKIAKERLQSAADGTLPLREEKPVYVPAAGTPLTVLPAEWLPNGDQSNEDEKISVHSN